MAFADLTMVSWRTLWLCLESGILCITIGWCCSTMLCPCEGYSSYLWSWIFPLDFLLIFIPGGIINIFAKIARKSAIYILHLMLTNTLVASVRNPRKICSLLKSNSAEDNIQLRRKKKKTKNRRGTVNQNTVICEQLVLLLWAYANSHFIHQIDENVLNWGKRW